jgi:hypothetical protein
VYAAGSTVRDTAANKGAGCDGIPDRRASLRILRIRHDHPAAGSYGVMGVCVQTKNGKRRRPRGGTAAALRNARRRDGMKRGEAT